MPETNELCKELITVTNGGGFGRLAAWHLPGGTVGLSATWAATSNVEVGKMKVKWATYVPLIPRFKTKVLSELLNPQTIHQLSSFVIFLLLCDQLNI